MPLDLHAKGFAPVRNIQIELNLTKQKCQFVCYGQVGADEAGHWICTPKDLHLPVTNKFTFLFN
jgi:hypothetical protein